MTNAKFIIQKSVVLKQYNLLTPLADIISYSSKTNPLVTPLLESDTECLFSIHFINELKHLKDKSRALFLAQGWNVEQIRFLFVQGVRFFVVDNLPDLDQLLSFVRAQEEKINLLLRVKFRENTINTERYFAFGLSSVVVNEKIKEIREDVSLFSKIEHLGIHFHRKTQNMSEWDLLEELNNALNEDNLKNINLVNIGGGLPSEYANTNVQVINSIFTKIGEFKKYLNQHQIKLMIEPGRFIAAPSCKLVTQIVRIYDHNIIINASVYNSDMDALIVPVKLKIENELTPDKGQPYVIKGNTPCSMDMFRYRVYLNNPQEGDTLVFLNAGAYNFCTNFCDLEEIETEVVE